MADLVIRKEDGWDELENVLEALRVGHLDVGTFWSAVARGSTKAALRELEDAGYEFYHPVSAVRAYYEPDEIHGEFLRIWVKYK